MARPRALQGARPKDSSCSRSPLRACVCWCVGGRGRPSQGAPGRQPGHGGHRRRAPAAAAFRTSSQLRKLLAQAGYLGAQRGYLLLQLDAVALGLGRDLLCALLSLVGDLSRTLLGLGRELLRALLGLLNLQIDFTAAFVEQLQAFLQQARRLGQSPALLRPRRHRPGIVSLL